MVNGLNINENEFLEMLTKQQNLILFRNTEYLKISQNDLKKMIKSYKFEIWTHRVSIVVLFILTGIGKITGFI